jgi:hypothetical protein
MRWPRRSWPTKPTPDAMRLLVLHQPQRYANPARRVFYDALRREPGVVFAGPEQPNASASIRALDRKFGPFDAILAELWAMWPRDEMGQLYAPHMPLDLFDLNTPVIGAAMQLDLHNLPESLFVHTTRCAAILTLVASPQSMDNWPPARLWREPWARVGDPYTLKNAHRFDDRWVMLPHAVGHEEFAWRDYRRRRYDVSVLGVGYNFRNISRVRLAARPDIGAEFLDDPLQRALARAVVTWPALSARLGLMRAYNERFVRALRDSRVSITCEGSANYPIRKFFEIPAAGALLAARFFDFAGDLGFVDRENCLWLDEGDPHAAVAAVEFARSDASAAERMARAGQAMVRDLHNADRRVGQLGALVDAVARGRFRTSHWSQGRFVVETV